MTSTNAVGLPGCCSVMQPSKMSREEKRNIQRVEQFTAAEAKNAILESKKSRMLHNLGSGYTQNCCSVAPCFVATENDLMDFSAYLNRLAPAAIEAGIIKITVPEELRAKLLPCLKPSFSDFPCKVQVMRLSSKHERIGAANLVGHHFGKSSSTTLESMIRRTKKMRSSLGIQEDGDPLAPEAMEAEFWKWVEHCSKNKSCKKGLYASDIEFNSSRDWKYGSLETLSNHSDSLLRHDLVGKIAGVNTSMIYVGAAFSFFPWHYEDNMLYSLNYHHEGDAKTWYGIAASDSPTYETVVGRRLFPEIVGKQPHHVWAKSSLVEPAVLAQHGVKVTSCVQRPGDFILTSPGGYHQGFCHGYCFAEALNWAPFSWFPYCMSAAKFYREIAFPATVISTDQLLLSCAQELVNQSSNHRLLCTVGTSALSMLRSLHSHVQVLSNQGIRIETLGLGSIKEHGAVRCDYCQHICHIAHAVVRTADESGSISCCLDHLVYQRDAYNVDLGSACVYLREDIEDTAALINSLSRRLSATPSSSVSTFSPPSPIIEIIDEFILKKNKRKSKAARMRDSQISDPSQELQDHPHSIMPPSFQYRPFTTALRMNHLREFRVNLPDFFEGSTSNDRMPSSIQVDHIEYHSSEKSIDRESFPPNDAPYSHAESVLDDVSAHAHCQKNDVGPHFSSLHRTEDIVSPKKRASAADDQFVSSSCETVEISKNAPKRARGTFRVAH